MRLDSALVHQPPNHLGRAVTCIGDQARRSEIELFGRAVEHRLGRADFGLTNGRSSPRSSMITLHASDR